MHSPITLQLYRSVLTVKKGSQELVIRTALDSISTHTLEYYVFVQCPGLPGLRFPLNGNSFKSIRHDCYNLIPVGLKGVKER